MKIMILSVLASLFTLSAKAELVEFDDDLLCSGRVCTHDPYGGACTNVTVRVNLEEEILDFSRKNDSNSGDFLRLDITDVNFNRSRGVFTVKSSKGDMKTTFVMNVYGSTGVRGEFRGTGVRKVEYNCSRAVINP